MFETIGNLLTIALWAAALFFFGGGVIMIICGFTDGNGGEIAKSVISIILGVITFAGVYSWLDSIVWCLFFSGMVMGLVQTFGDEETHPAPTAKTGPSVGDVILTEMIQYQRDKEVVKNALREYENER